MKARKTPSARLALYPGSFDPVHNGHLNIIRRAARLFDRVYVAVAENLHKTPIFSVEERIQMLREAIADAPNVEVIAVDGLTVDSAKKLGIGVIVRGLRLVSDFESELLLDMHNRRLDPSIETLYLMPEKEFICFNSSFVKQIVKFDPERLVDYVPASVFRRLSERFPLPRKTVPAGKKISGKTGDI